MNTISMILRVWNDQHPVFKWQVSTKSNFRVIINEHFSGPRLDQSIVKVGIRQCFGFDNKIQSSLCQVSIHFRCLYSFGVIAFIFYEN